MVKQARELTDTALSDASWVLRWVGPAFALFSAALIPWIVYLGLTLPAREVSHHYNVAWVGFDVLELVALGATGYFALRHSRYLALTSAAAATLLVVDAWFDILTSPRHEIMQAIASAIFIELPLAAVCAWLSYHTEHLAERRISVRRDLWGGLPSRGGPGRNPDD
jgi:hypothetical protein